MGKAGALEEDGADGLRGRGEGNFEPLEDVWGPSDDDDVEDEEGVEDDDEREGMAERECLGLTAEEECCGDDDGDGEDEEGVDRGADEGHLRPVYGDLERADRGKPDGTRSGTWSLSCMTSETEAVGELQPGTRGLRRRLIVGSAPVHVSKPGISHLSVACRRRRRLRFLSSVLEIIRIESTALPDVSP